MIGRIIPHAAARPNPVGRLAAREGRGAPSESRAIKQAKTRPTTALPSSIPRLPRRNATNPTTPIPLVALSHRRPRPHTPHRPPLVIPTLISPVISFKRARADWSLTVHGIRGSVGYRSGQNVQLPGRTEQEHMLCSCSKRTPRRSTNLLLALSLPVQPPARVPTCIFT